MKTNFLYVHLYLFRTKTSIHFLSQSYLQKHHYCQEPRCRMLPSHHRCRSYQPLRSGQSHPIIAWRTNGHGLTTRKLQLITTMGVGGHVIIRHSMRVHPYSISRVKIISHVPSEGNDQMPGFSLDHPMMSSHFLRSWWILHLPLDFHFFPLYMSYVSSLTCSSYKLLETWNCFKMIKKFTKKG